MFGFKANSLAIAAVCALGTAGWAYGGVVYSYTPDLPYIPGAVSIAGEGQQQDLWWANSFTAQTGGQWITTLQAAFDGDMPVGTQVSLLLYSDPSNSNNPNDLQLVASTTGTVGAEGNDGENDVFDYQQYSIAPTYVSGELFVAVEADNLSSSAGIPLDGDSPQGRSFIAGNITPDNGTLTPTNLASADLPPTNIDAAVGASQPTYNFFVGALGRSTQLASQQPPMTFDDFMSGNVTVSPNTGSQVSAPTVVGGQRGIISVGGTTTVANGKLTISDGQATIFYGAEYVGGEGFGSGLNTEMHADLEGYQYMQFHFEEPDTQILIGMWGAASPTAYETDSNGNLDFSVSGQDLTDFNSLSYTIYSYGGSVSLDSITLITPEPASASLILVAVPMLLARRRR